MSKKSQKYVKKMKGLKFLGSLTTVNQIEVRWSM